MGKGTIIAHLGAGQYTLAVNQERARITAAIATLTARIAELETKLSGMATGKEKSWVNLQKAALETRLALLQDHTTDPTVTAWCADLTVDLSGEVGTLEIPGERGTVQIRPGYMGAAAYSAARDGQLQEAIASTPAGTFYNLALLPGWQKYKPTVRWGVLSDLDTDAHTCTVTLDAAQSSAQGLDINQAPVLTGVPIDYMSCNSTAFTNGDHVLVEFTDQDFDDPVVIGFKDHPKPCAAGEYVIISTEVFVSPDRWTYVTVWNVVASQPASIPGVSFPCASDNAVYAAWLADTLDVGEDLYTQSYQGQHQDDALLDPCPDCEPDTGDCKTCSTAITDSAPDPTSSDHETKLPFIDPQGDTVTNWANCDETQCDNTSTGWIDTDYTKQVMLSCYRDLSGTRLPASLKLDIENNVDGQSALQISCLQKRVFSGDWLTDTTTDTDTYATYCALGKIGEIVETEQNMYWGYNAPTYQEQTLVYYSGPMVAGVYSDATLVQAFGYAVQTMTRSRSREYSYDDWGDWSAGDWTDETLHFMASCRACDGANTDPRNETNSPALVTAITALKTYADAQGHGDSGAISLDIVQHNDD